MLELRPFQRRFLRAALRPEIDTAALSIPRGNGKSTLAGYLVARLLTPGSGLHRAGQESILCAGSIVQARIVYRVARGFLEPLGGYRFADSANTIQIVHEDSNTRLRVMSSNARTAFGIVGCPLAICDEPGAWEVRGGGLMFDALQTAQGKPGSPLKVLYVGTLAPATAGWWHDLVKSGSRDSTYVMALQGDNATWDRWSTIRRANPLCEISPAFRKKLLEERDAARSDPRLEARYKSFRLNLPSAEEGSTLLTTADWKSSCARKLPDREGRPVVGIDLGGNRAWSAAAAVWRSGRCEALAIAPGRPDLAAQEKRDVVPAGTYRRLYEGGSLRVAEGLHVPPASMLLDAVREAWGRPDCLICDRFRLCELEDAAGRIPTISRVSRWSESSFDIRALRKMAKDGPLAVAPDSRPLLLASLATAEVLHDDAGNVRMTKRSTNNTGRDDVAAALVLAAGAFERAGVGRSTHIYHGSV